MTDKRLPSGRPSSRPPLPSIAPPTDDIDSEWGEVAIPAPAPLPKVTASSVPAPASVLTAAAAPASTPPRASVPSAASDHAPRRSENPLRKQTLFGIAPVLPRPASVAPADSKPPEAPLTPAPEPPPVLTTSSVAPRSANPLRKQTLIGVAPPLAATKSAAGPEEAPVPASLATAAPTATAAPAANESAQRLATPSPVTSDAPTTARTSSAAVRRTSAPPSGPGRLNTTDADLRALRPRRGLLVPLLAAAAAALVYVALNRMDETRAPQALAEAPTQQKAAAAPTPPTMPAEEPTEGALPTGAANPIPTPAGTTEASVSAAAASAAAAPAAPGAALPSPGEVKRVSLVTDPPGARLFWRGKEMGTTPFVLEIPAGERRSFELGRPGYVTRKLVIDGSRSDISIGLRPDSSASQAGTTRIQ